MGRDFGPIGVFLENSLLSFQQNDDDDVLMKPCVVLAPVLFENPNSPFIQTFSYVVFALYIFLLLLTKYLPSCVGF